MGSITDFVSEINKTGFSRANRYEMVFVVPTAVNGLSPGLSRSLTYRIASVNLPSKSIATTETKVYGPVRQAPYSTTYDQLTFSMYLSKDLRERKSMENWMHYIVDYDNHKIRYLNEYKGSIYLSVFDEQDTRTAYYHFMEAFPLSIGEVSLAYANEDVAQCQITMSYRKYIETDSKQWQAANGSYY